MSFAIDLYMIVSMVTSDYYYPVCGCLVDFFLSRVEKILLWPEIEPWLHISVSCLWPLSHGWILIRLLLPCLWMPCWFFPIKGWENTVIARDWTLISYLSKLPLTSQPWLNIDRLLKFCWFIYPLIISFEQIYKKFITSLEESAL